MPLRKTQRRARRIIGRPQRDDRDLTIWASAVRHAHRMKFAGKRLVHRFLRRQNRRVERECLQHEGDPHG